MLAAVTIGVFGLFHPTELKIEPVRGNALLITYEGRDQVLEGSASATLSTDATVTARNGTDASFFLSVPGKIRRQFRGRLAIHEVDHHLTAIVTMDRETAVASILAAESPGLPLESQKAQAVVTRSFLIAAGRRHDGFDFCDTTHCQYLREPPPAGGAARRAQEATRGLALTYQGRTIVALYSANCGGSTRTAEDAGWRMEGYPFFSVECPVKNVVSGHRVGMCQAGAAFMARQGISFRDILSHYFPAASIEAIPE